MKLHKQLKWLHPYLESVAHIVPLDKLLRINLRFYQEIPSEYAYCNRWEDGTFTILLRISEASKDKIPLPYWTQEDVLILLAHELTHLIFPDHPPERFLLEALIMHQFATVLFRLGYEEKRNEVK